MKSLYYQAKARATRVRSENTERIRQCFFSASGSALFALLTSDSFYVFSRHVLRERVKPQASLADIVTIVSEPPSFGGYKPITRRCR